MSVAMAMYERMGFKLEPYKPEAKDAASMVTVFSMATSPEHDVEERSWKNCAYPMLDFDKHVIPYMNKKHGFDTGGAGGGKCSHTPPVPPSP